MKKIFTTVLAIVLVIGIVFAEHSILSQTTTASAEENMNYFEEKSYCSATLEDDFADNRVLVTLKSEVSKEFNSYSKEDFFGISCVSVADLSQESAQMVKRQQLEGTASDVDIRNFKTVLSLELAEKNKENVLETIRELEKRDDVLYAEPDYIMTFFADPNPKPTYYNSQWAIPKISLPSAWDITKGNSSVKVAIMDSGIQANHTDLSGKVDTALSRDFNLSSPYIPSSVTDPEGHGTWVAGIVAAKGIGVIGVAPDVTLVSLRIANPDINPSTGQYQLSGNAAAFISTATLAFDYCAGKNFDVINLSAGYYGTPSSTLKSKIEACGSLVVCAAGNENNDNDGSTPVYPASFNSANIISVGATKSDDTRPNVSDWGYDNNGNPQGSNYGATSVDLFAPGDNIISTFPTNTYMSAPGTSAAAPMVAGVAALIKSANPSLSAAEIKGLIVDNVDFPIVNGVNPLQGKCVSNGRLNALKALQKANTMPVTDGVYKIQSKTSGKLIHAANAANGAAAHLWEAANSDNEIFNFERQSDGTYKITVLCSNKVLDNPNLSVSNGTQLKFYDWNGGDNQKWYVFSRGGGDVKIINKYSGKAVDIKNNATANGTPVQQWDDLGVDAQRFRLLPLNLPSQSTNISDGVYEIQSKTSGKYIHTTSGTGDGLAHLWQSTNTDNQRFNFTRQSDGTYKITALSSDCALDNTEWSYSNGSQFIFHNWHGDDNQRWYIIDCGGGYVKIINKHSGLVVDIQNNATANGTKVQQWSDAGVDAQRFRLMPVGLPSTSMNISNGVYKIQGKTSGKLIHAANSTSGAAAHLWESVNVDNERLNFVRQSDGTYKITVLSSGYALDNNGWSYNNGNQLRFYAWSGGDNQRWYVVDCGGGYVKIINKHSGKAIDISNNATANGTPVQQWDDLGVDAQRFRLMPV